MSDPSQLWTSVDDYFGERLLGEDPVLTGALGRSAAAGLPAIAVSPLQGKFLHMLAKVRGARTILEVGTLGGYSAIWLARALAGESGPGGGRGGGPGSSPEVGSGGGSSVGRSRLITLELEPKNAEVARENLARAGLAEVAEVRVGPAIQTLARLAQEIARSGIGQTGLKTFDLVFIDADKPSNPEYFAWALKLTAAGSIIVIDNVVREGAVVDAASTNPGVQGVRRLMDMIKAEARVTGTVLQTVGSKGWDGFAVVVVG